MRHGENVITSSAAVCPLHNITLHIANPLSIHYSGTKCAATVAVWWQSHLFLLNFSVLIKNLDLFDVCGCVPASASSRLSMLPPFCTWHRVTPNLTLLPTLTWPRPRGGWCACSSWLADMLRSMLAGDRPSMTLELEKCFVAVSQNQ